MNGMVKPKRHFSNNRNYSGQNRHSGGGGGRHKNNNGGNALHHHNMDDNVVHPSMRRPLQTQKDRYVALARDALSSGDRILAEYYYQYVEHFSRMINLIPAPQQNHRQPNANQAQDAQEENGQEADMGNEANHSADAQEAPNSNYESAPSSYYARSSQPASAPAPAPMPMEENE